MRKCGKIWYSWTDHRWQYGACALHAGYPRLQIHTQDMWYVLLSQCISDCTNAPHCYVILTLAILFDCLLFHSLFLVGPFKHGVRCDITRLWTSLNTKTAVVSQKAYSRVLCDSHKKRRLSYYWWIFHFVLGSLDSQCHVRTKSSYIG